MSCWRVHFINHGWYSFGLWQIVAWLCPAITWTNAINKIPIICGKDVDANHRIMFPYPQTNEIKHRQPNKYGPWRQVTFSCLFIKTTLIARFMGPTWGPSGADRTQVGPMLALWALLSGYWLVASLMSRTASLVTTRRKQQYFKVFIDIHKLLLLLFNCCIPLEIKLTTTNLVVLWFKYFMNWRPNRQHQLK